MVLRLLLLIAVGLLFSGKSLAQPPIRIGAFLAVTGPAAFLGDPEQKTLELYVEKLNAQGGVLGRKLELHAYDSAGDAEKARAYVKRLIEQDKVDVLVGGSTTGETMAAVPLAEAAQIPFISLAGAVVIVEPVKKWVFKTPHTDRMACEKVFVDMRARGATRAALISGSGGFDKSMRAECLKVAGKHGVQIVADETYGAGDTDMTAQLAKIKANPKVQAVLNAGYDLLPNYADLFGPNSENTRESIFEVQFSDRNLLATGSRGNNIPRMIGPCGPGFCDGNPTEWYFDQFFVEQTAAGETDPRLDATIFWNRPGGMDVFGTPFAQRYGDRLDDKFWKKYSEYWMTEQDWDSAINFKVIRLGEVLLMYAEALNEMGRTQEAYAPINRVRARVGLRPLEQVKPGLSRDAMREQIGQEIMLELGLEHSRFFFLKRHNLLAPALVAHDPEFQFFVDGKSELLPIPQSEVDLNPNVDQNTGW